MDGVVVAGTSLLLNPVLSVMMQKMNIISPEGKSKPFDASGIRVQFIMGSMVLSIFQQMFPGTGTVRSDAVVIVYMQRAKDAKRVYTTAVNVCTNNEGFRPEGAIYPTNDQQIELFKEVLENAKLKPVDVDYIESSAGGCQVY